MGPNDDTTSDPVSEVLNFPITILHMLCCPIIKHIGKTSLLFQVLSSNQHTMRVNRTHQLHFINSILYSNSTPSVHWIYTQTNYLNSSSPFQKKPQNLPIILEHLIVSCQDQWSLCVPLKLLFSLLLLALAITCTSSARIFDEDETPLPTTAPVTPGSVVTPAGPAAATSAAAVTNADPHYLLIFFMHDFLGGSNPSARAVTGIVANTAVTGQVAFAKPNGANLSLNNGVPINNNNNGLVNNNNVYFLTGRSGTTANVPQNNGNNNFPHGGFANIPVLNGGQVPAGSTL